MAIGYSPLGLPQANAFAMSAPDFGAAFQQGMERGMSPHKQSAELLSMLLQNKSAAAKAKYAEKMEQANLGHIGAQTQGLNIANQYMPTKLQQEIDRNKFLLDNPLLNLSGAAQQVGAMDYLRRLAAKNANQNMQAGNVPGEQQQGVQSQKPPEQLYADMIEKSLANQFADKNAQALELFKQKEAIKAANKKLEQGENVPLTNAMKTKLQGVVKGVDDALPVIQELVEGYKDLPTGAEFFSPEKYAAYNAQANSIVEPLINAFGLNVTEGTKHMMEGQVLRQTNESKTAYRDRLVNLAKEIIRRRKDADTNSKQGHITPKAEFTNEFFEHLKNESPQVKFINGKKYTLINGEWHE